MWNSNAKATNDRKRTQENVKRWVMWDDCDRGRACECVSVCVCIVQCVILPLNVNVALSNETEIQNWHNELIRIWSQYELRISVEQAFHRNQLTEAYKNNELNVIDGFSVSFSIYLSLFFCVSLHLLSFSVCYIYVSLWNVALSETILSFRNCVVYIHFPGTKCWSLRPFAPFILLIYLFSMYFDRIRLNLLRVSDALHIDLLAVIASLPLLDGIHTSINKTKLSMA